MWTSHEERRWRTHAARLAVAALLVTAVHSLSATTYMSVEPIPNRDVIGDENLALLRSIGYDHLERWSELLLSQCLVVDRVDRGADDAWRDHVGRGGRNTRFVVAAGGFEGATNPSYVFTVRDSGPGAASMRDVNVLDNALGYVLNQGGTVHFSPDNDKAYAFVLDYAVVTFHGTLSGDEARQFFEQLGTDRPRPVQRPVRGLHANRLRRFLDQQLDAVSAAGRE